MQLARTLRKAWRKEKKSIEDELAKQPAAAKTKTSTPSTAAATTAAAAATTTCTAPLPNKDVSAVSIETPMESSSSATPAVETQFPISPTTVTTASLPVEVVPDKEVLAATLQEAVDLLCQLDTKSYFAFPVCYHPISSLYLTN